MQKGTLGTIKLMKTVVIFVFLLQGHLNSFSKKQKMPADVSDMGFVLNNQEAILQITTMTTCHH